MEFSSVRSLLPHGAPFHMEPPSIRSPLPYGALFRPVDDSMFSHLLGRPIIDPMYSHLLQHLANHVGYVIVACLVTADYSIRNLQLLQIMQLYSEFASQQLAYLRNAHGFKNVQMLHLEDDDLS